MLCRRQIGIYIGEFEKARAAGNAAARDAPRPDVAPSMMAA